MGVVSPTPGARSRPAPGRVLDALIVIIDKRRPRDDVVEVVHVVGDVAGMHAVIVDDLVSTGGTWSVRARPSEVEAPPASTWSPTDGLLDRGAIDVFRQAPIDEIRVDDIIRVSDPAHVLDNDPGFEASETENR